MVKATDYADLIIAQRSGNPVRLRDVAEVSESFESVKSLGRFKDERSIVIAILRQPSSLAMDAASICRCRGASWALCVDRAFAQCIASISQNCSTWLSTSRRRPRCIEVGGCSSFVSARLVYVAQWCVGQTL